MSQQLSALSHFNSLEDFANLDAPVQRIHPLSKLTVTLLFLVVTVSFPRDAFISMIPLLLFPVITSNLGDIPLGFLFKRLLLVEPFIICIAIFNPIVDRVAVPFAGISLPGGWLTFFSLVIKAGLTVVAALLLVATTRIENVATALRTIGIPRPLVLQLMLTYRYINLLLDETSRLLLAHSLRSPGKKGVRYQAWGSFVGQLIFRTYDRAIRIHLAMHLRGFRDDYRLVCVKRWRFVDTVYLVIWVLFFWSCFRFDIPRLLGNFFVR